MKKLVSLFVVLTIIFVSCRQPGKNVSSATPDSKFQQLSEDFLKGYLAWRPELSVYLGFHDYDGKTSDLSKKSLDDELTRLKSFDQMLNKFDTASLSPRMYDDFRILQCGIKTEIFSFDDM